MIKTLISINLMEAVLGITANATPYNEGDTMRPLKTNSADNSIEMSRRDRRQSEEGGNNDE